MRARAGAGGLTEVVATACPKPGSALEQVEAGSVGQGRMVYDAVIPAWMWWFTWQWYSQVPGFSATVSKLTWLAGSRLTTSTLRPVAGIANAGSGSAHRVD